KAPGQIILPALRDETAPLTDLLHGHAIDQHVVHQRRSVGTELALDPVQPQRGLALTLGDRIAGLHAVDVFAGRIDRLRPPLRALPIPLEGAGAPRFRLPD